MVVSKGDIVRNALKVLDTSPSKSNFKQAVEIAYLEAFDVQRENISPESYLKIESEFLIPFCKQVKEFYTERKNGQSRHQGKPERMISAHQKHFDMAVPNIFSFFIDPDPPPDDMEIDVDVAPTPAPAGDGGAKVKKPLKKTQRLKVHIITAVESVWFL